jgi:hypothetical protein
MQDIADVSGFLVEAYLALTTLFPHGQRLEGDSSEMWDC